MSDLISVLRNFGIDGLLTIQSRAPGLRVSLIGFPARKNLDHPHRASYFRITFSSSRFGFA